MNWVDFHHPDLSPTVLRRRAADEFLDFLYEVGDLTRLRHRYFTHAWDYPSRTAYFRAVYRLRDKGLVAYRREGGRNPVIRLTGKGKASRPDAFRPEQRWSRRWNKLWYVLVYDVPEKDRGYRNVLRSFLKRMQMGRLQGSVWVTPDDIRPDYDDLIKAAAVDNFAFLFEARTVLGQKAEMVVRSAWDIEQLEALQGDYCRTTSANLDRLRSGSVRQEDLLRLARRNLSAYLRVMRDDPLLPRPLWPTNYLGPETLRLHRELVRELRRLL